MIASLASFTGQYSVDLLAKAMKLFDDQKASVVSLQEETYTLKVDDGKLRQVMVRVVGTDVTDVFCTCGPAVCAHSIASMFVLRKLLKVKEEPFSEKIFQPAPSSVLGNRLNNIVYPSRAADTKDGELEELGQHTSLKDLTASKLEAKAVANLSGYDHHPIFTGAKRLLGAAIREYENENYEAVFAVAKAILKSICRLEIMSNSADECCKAAIALLEELYAGKQTNNELKQQVFEWLMKAWPHELLESYSDELLSVIADHPLDKAHADLLLAKIQERADTRQQPFYGPELKVGYELLKQNDMMLAQEWRERFVDYFLKELVEDAVKAGDYATAKTYAARGLTGRYFNESRQWLYEIALVQGDTEGLREHYMDAFVRSGKMDDYEEMRKRFASVEALHAQLPMILNSIARHHRFGADAIVLHVLVREEMREEVLAQLQRFGTYDMLMEAATVLLPYHPKEFYDRFKRSLLYDIQHCKQRERAREFGEKLKQVRKLPGGKAMVSQMLSELFDQNPGWKVMKEELGKYI